MIHTVDSFEKALREIFDREEEFIRISHEGFVINPKKGEAQFTVRCTDNDVSNLCIELSAQQFKHLSDLIGGAKVVLLIQKLRHDPPFLEVNLTGLRNVVENPI